MKKQLREKQNEIDDLKLDLSRRNINSEEANNKLHIQINKKQEENTNLRIRNNELESNNKVKF
jgi:hypothetical protein